jgi:trimeric autotransporter adhesin
MSHSFAIRKLSLGIALTLSVVTCQTAIASTCPFDGGGSDAVNDGVVLTRYALGITGAPLVASTRYASLDPLQVKNNIECIGCALDMNGDGQIDTVDTTIIARHLTGFSGTALTNGLALGSAPGASRPTTAAITSFLASGCAAGGAINAWTQGGNAFGATGVIGTTDNKAFEIMAGNQRVARFEPGSLSAVGDQYGPNIALGHGSNVASVPALPDITGATVSGGGSTGSPNQALAAGATVSGGKANTASGVYSTVAGGRSNVASGQYSAAIGGNANAATGDYGSVLGGYRNFAGGAASLAGGTQSSASHFGSFVWADASSASATYLFPSTAINQFRVRATGGVEFVTATNPTGTATRSVGINTNGALDFGSVTRQSINLWGDSGQYGIGVQFGTTYFRTDSAFPRTSKYGFSWHSGGVHDDGINAPGAGGTELMRLSTNGDLQVTGNLIAYAILNTSDRNAKSLIRSINPQAILAKVAALPISRWVYNADEKKSWHLGPMAQDFRAAFGLGQDDKTIATVDAGGVALAAIQGLNVKVMAQIKAKDAEIASLQKAHDALLQKLAAIEKRLGLN